MKRNKLVLTLLIVLISVFLLSLTASAAETDPNNPIPGLNVNIGTSGTARWIFQYSNLIAIVNRFKSCTIFSYFND